MRELPVMLRILKCVRRAGGWRGDVCLLVLRRDQDVGPATAHLGETKLPSLMGPGQRV